MESCMDDAALIFRWMLSRCDPYVGFFLEPIDEIVLLLARSFPFDLGAHLLLHLFEGKIGVFLPMLDPDDPEIIPSPHRSSDLPLGQRIERPVQLRIIV